MALVVAARASRHLAAPATSNGTPPAPHHQTKRRDSSHRKASKPKNDLVLPELEPGAEILSAHQVGQLMSESKGVHTVTYIIGELIREKMVPAGVSESRLRNLKKEYENLKAGARVG